MLSHDFLLVPRENSSEAITPYAIEQLFDRYSTIPLADRKCLEDTARKLISHQLPKLEGQKILLNTHITTITLILIDLLRLAGANVSVTATQNLVIHADALLAIKRAAKNANNKLEWIEQKNHTQTLTDFLRAKRNDFDITIDCGGGLIGLVVPKRRGVELTHTDPSLYKGITYPVINVDDSQLKKIETRYGTGNAVCRLFQEVFPGSNAYNAAYNDLMIAADVLKRTNAKKSNELSHEARGSWFDKSHKFVIIGGGQVGMGIAHALRAAYTYDVDTDEGTAKATIGVDKNNITIVDTNRAPLSFLKFEGYNTLLIDPKELAIEEINLQQSISALNTQLKELDKQSDKAITMLKDIELKNSRLTEIARLREKYIAEIKARFKEAYCVITATGVEGCMSKHFEPNDFPPNCILINMGTPDEWGSKFPHNRVLNDKKPANFLMAKPTEVHFLDPVFTALIYGCFIPLSPTETQGLIPFPKQADDLIITMFRNYYPHIDIFDALNRVVFHNQPASPRWHIFKMDEDDSSSRDPSPTTDSALSDDSSGASLESSTPPSEYMLPNSISADTASQSDSEHIPVNDLQSLSLTQTSSAEKVKTKSAPNSPTKRKGGDIEDLVERKNLERVQNAEVFKGNSSDTLFKSCKKQVSRKLDFDAHNSFSSTRPLSTTSVVISPHIGSRVQTP